MSLSHDSGYLYGVMAAANLIRREILKYLTKEVYTSCATEMISIETVAMCAFLILTNLTAAVAEHPRLHHLRSV
jgi:hypothetical protein